MHSLPKKCSCSEFFWSVFSRIWTKYRNLPSKCSYLVQIWENTDQKISENGHFLCSNGTNPTISRTSYWRCSVKKVFVKFRKSHKKANVLESLFNKLAGLKDCSFIKKRLQQKSFLVSIANS